LKGYAAGVRVLDAVFSTSTILSEDLGASRIDVRALAYGLFYGLNIPQQVFGNEPAVSDHAR